MTNPDVQEPRGRAQELQAKFFAATNQCVPSEMGVSPEHASTLRASLRRHASGSTERAVLLPYRERDDGPTAWFACAASTQALRALQDEVRAFLGPSFVEEYPQGLVPDLADQHALPLIAAAGWHAIRFDSKGERNDEMVLRQWRLYDELVSRRPRASSYVPHTFHQLRASFDRALLARNESDARAAVSTLRERFGISAENRQFLEIRLNAAFERWDAIVQNPLLPQLFHLQLPPEIYGDVMEALYRSEVQPYESADSLEPLLQQFAASIAEPAQPLFRTRRTSRRPSVLKAFVLYELVQAQPQLKACERLLAELPDGTFGELDGLLRARCATPEPATGLGSAQEALGNEQFDRAWELFWDLDDAVDVLRGLIACARESTDPAKATAVLSRLEAVAPDIRAKVETASATRLANLRQAHQAPSTPESLAVQLAQLDGEPEDRYVERFGEFARSVEPNALLTEEGFVDAAINYQIRLAIEQSVLFERVYPLWHELFIERMEPDPRLVPLYIEMLETLRARDVFQRTDQELLHQTLIAIVESGDDASYRRAVDAMTKVFEVVRSPQSLPWALDVCDSLSQRRVRDADARLRLLTQVVQACLEYGERLEPLQFYQLRLLAQEAQIQLPQLASFEAAAANEAVERVDTPYRVALYSLDASATRRAVELLQSLHPAWVIEPNADHVCSERLKALVRRADVFVFAWRCSKHAAYYCVKANSKKENLVMAAGVGTTSLVAAAENYLSGRAA